VLSLCRLSRGRALVLTSSYRALDALAEREGPGRVVLIADDDGQVLEAAWANVWLLDGRGLRTPPADGRILPGVARSRLLSLAPSLGLQAAEMPIPLTDVERAPTVFLTSSLRVGPAVTPTSDRARFVSHHVRDAVVRRRGRQPDRSRGDRALGAIDGQHVP